MPAAQTATTVAALSAVVLVTWTASAARPRVFVCDGAETAATFARDLTNRNAEKIALEDDARAQLAHLPEIAALVPRTARVTCQVKRLRGERALAVLAANNEVERSQDDEDACPVDRATAEAALVDAYLAA